MLQAVGACPEPENGYLLMSSWQVVWISTVVVWMLAFPLGLLLGLDDGLGFRVAGRPVYLLLCCTLFYRGVCSLIAQHITVGRYPLWGTLCDFCIRRQEEWTGYSVQCLCLIVGPAGRTEYQSGRQRCGWH